MIKHFEYFGFYGYSEPKDIFQKKCFPGFRSFGVNAKELKDLFFDNPMFKYLKMPQNRCIAKFIINGPTFFKKST